eukprot:6224384-Prymnesium_polylepis.2
MAAVAEPSEEKYSRASSVAGMAVARARAAGATVPAVTARVEAEAATAREVKGTAASWGASVTRAMGVALVARAARARCGPEHRGAGAPQSRRARRSWGCRAAPPRADACPRPPA